MTETPSIHMPLAQRITASAWDLLMGWGARAGTPSTASQVSVSPAPSAQEGIGADAMEQAHALAQGQGQGREEGKGKTGKKSGKATPVPASPPRSPRASESGESDTPAAGGEASVNVRVSLDKKGRKSLDNGGKRNLAGVVFRRQATEDPTETAGDAGKAERVKIKTDDAQTGVKVNVNGAGAGDGSTSLNVTPPPRIQHRHSPPSPPITPSPPTHFSSALLAQLGTSSSLVDSQSSTGTDSSDRTAGSHEQEQKEAKVDNKAVPLTKPGGLHKISSDATLVSVSSDVPQSPTSPDFLPLSTSPSKSTSASSSTTSLALALASPTPSRPSLPISAAIPALRPAPSSQPSFHLSSTPLPPAPPSSAPPHPPPPTPSPASLTPTTSTPPPTRPSTTPPTPPGFPTHALPPAFLAAYTVESVLGSGGFGYVLGCTRIKDGKKGAAKVVERRGIKRQQWVNVGSGEWVPVEVWCLQNLAHQGIIPLLDYFPDHKTLVIVMAHHGRVHPPSPLSPPPLPASPAAPAPTSPQFTTESPCDLFEAIELYGPFGENEAQVVFYQLVEAVAFLWERGWLHRDVKDENVVVDVETLEVRLIDFGSANQLPTAHGRAIFDKFFGTMTYASPDVLRGGAYDGEKQEVWSLGIVLYCLLFGEAPFSTPQQVLGSPLRFTISSAVLAAVRAAHPSSLSLRPTSPLLHDPPPRVSESVCDVLRGMLERSENSRWSLEELRRCEWVQEGGKRWREMRRARGEIDA
ncbi:Pkinase-domain-containing protein [Gonapodya prolifera JEL478]|uniref:Pkinase-domain-containing protein n=1 Tax=Gonapodya prolifera (strain JEL478) TaxID=1344416 RepID=A0A139AIF4_GONPJ|nr:Pkinase-domain-containing protein [Gonapodya prolifera JEL478]|eukprot:KXS16582.1 Pkinase-domain-containing protein [Gonapodya prolifera JEL478]